MKVMGLLNNGTKYYNDKKFVNKAFVKYPKTLGESLFLKKGKDSFYDSEQLKPLWKQMFRVIVEFFNLMADSYAFNFFILFS